MKYGAKKDANHHDVVKAMRDAGASVFDMSAFGCGVPDGVAWCLNDTWQFFDVKNPKTAYGKRGLNERQKQWLGDRSGPVFLIYTTDEAMRFARGEFDGLKYEVGNTDAMNL